MFALNTFFTVKRLLGFCLLLLILEPNCNFPMSTFLSILCGSQNRYGKSSNVCFIPSLSSRKVICELLSYILNWSAQSFSLIIGSKVLFISYPIEFLPKFLAAKDVVPLPANGSRTVSPTKENILINRLGSSSGNIAICPICFTPLKIQCDEKY